MRLLSRFLVHTSARFLEDEYSIPYTTILRLDKEVLENDIPKPKMKDVQDVLIDEKYIGASQGFVTVCRQYFINHINITIPASVFISMCLGTVPFQQQ